MTRTEALKHLKAITEAFGPDVGIELDKKAWSKLHAAIKEALAQPKKERPQNCGTSYCSCIECVMEPEQEPVACASLCVECTKRGDWVCAKAIPPQRTWVGLTEDEAFACKGRDYFETYKAIEAKLKEKNT